jgi:ketosteroid isomerase-like protein
MKKLLFSALIASSLLACQSATKPAFDLANAKNEIEAANQEIAQFMSKGDSAGMASAYSTDGSVMLNNMPSIKGKAPLTSVWGGFIRAGVQKIQLTTLEVWGDENYITEEGTFVIKTKEDAQIDKGKYIVLWKKEDGKWKLHRDISNSDLPLVTN